MSYFSIAAPQSVTLPNGTTLHFRINPADSSQVEIHLTGERDGAKGTWVIPMRRNGSAAGAPEFSAAPTSSDAPPNRARIDAMDDSHPLKAELKRRQEAADNNVPLDADGNERDRAAAQPDKADERNPLAGYKSVNDDAVRPGTASVAEDGSIKPAFGETKVDPVHGVINATGQDKHAAKPEEGSNEKTSVADRREQSSVGLQTKP